MYTPTKDYDVELDNLFKSFVEKNTHLDGLPEFYKKVSMLMGELKDEIIDLNRQNESLQEELAGEEW
jgi:hypothetical protein